MRVTLYVRGRCPLCDDARDVLRRLGVGFDEVDIDGDDALHAKYFERIPVAERGGRVLVEGNFLEQPVGRLLGVTG